MYQATLTTQLLDIDKKIVSESARTVKFKSQRGLLRMVNNDYQKALDSQQCSNYHTALTKVNYLD